ncbi:MAG: hypothetical protein ACR2IJ_11215 [Fluviibacter sp.]
MTTTINASPTNGIVQTADGSGVLKVQSNGVTTNALAWLNYKGTATRAINASYNVSSVTYNGTGDYSVNFTTALTDANYAGLIGVSDTPGLNRIGGAYTGTRTTSLFRVITSAATTAAQTDNAEISVAIFGN